MTPAVTSPPSARRRPSARKAAGAYYTPADLARTLVTWAVRTPDDRLLDPSCGDGRFIACHAPSVGVDQDEAAVREAAARAPDARVHHADFFEWADATTERFDCVAGNPPFVRYQTFAGAARARARELCARHGAQFTGLASSWAPFLVAAATLLVPGGRMAFVVPAEIGHAPYAAPLLEYLFARFAYVQVVAVREKLFPDLSEDCWVLYADGFGGRTDRIRFTPLERFACTIQPPATGVEVPIDEWRSVWGRRLRPYLLPAEVRGAYQAAAAHPDSRRLGEVASVGIGYVSGANDFFHLRPSEAERLGIPASCLRPTVRNGRALPADGALTSATVEAWRRADEPMLLLHVEPEGDVPASVRRYLDSPAGREARTGYKCRVRTPWYAVPDVRVPDYMLGYMSGRSVPLVRNEAGVTCTNAVHAVRVRDRARADALLPQWRSHLVQLSCELEGHALGGGMLKLEPREAARVLLPSPQVRATADDRVTLREAVSLLRRWRHYE